MYLSACCALSAFCCSSGGAPIGHRWDGSTGSASRRPGSGPGGVSSSSLRGERLEWFASHEIQVEAALCVLGFYLFIVHTLSARDPFLDPALFRNRNFVIGIVLIFIVGVVLLGT